MKTLVIKVRHGGLGDHLFFSHVPLAAKASGFDRVLLSRQSAFRHPDYMKLWQQHPHLDGLTDDDENSGFAEFGTPRPGCNLLDEIMLRCGVDDGERHHEPVCFLDFKASTAVLKGFKPQRTPVLYDPNYVSYVGEIKDGQVDSMLVALDIYPKAQWEPGERSHRSRLTPVVIMPTTLEDYCAYITAAQRFICLTSGGATLAAALGVQALCLHGPGQNPMFHHSKLHRYVNVGAGDLA